MSTITSVQTRTTRTTFPLVRSIAISGLIMSVVGGVEFALFYFVTQQMGPVAVYQFIASGLMGPAAFAGGYSTALLGVAIHFAIAFVVAAVYLVPAAAFSFLRRFAWVIAPLYGMAVNVIMGMVVLPLTALPKAPLSMALLLNGFIGDAFFIGLPLALTIWGGTRSHD